MGLLKSVWLNKHSGEGVPLLWPRDPKLHMCLVPSGGTPEQFLAAKMTCATLSPRRTETGRVGSVPAGDLPPWCRVRMMAHLLSAQRGQGPDSAAGDTWLRRTPLSGRHLGAGLWCWRGTVWVPRVLWSSSLDFSRDAVPVFP